MTRPRSDDGPDVGYDGSAPLQVTIDDPPSSQTAAPTGATDTTAGSTAEHDAALGDPLQDMQAGSPARGGGSAGSRSNDAEAGPVDGQSAGAGPVERGLADEGPSGTGFPDTGHNDTALTDVEITDPGSAEQAGAERTLPTQAVSVEFLSPPSRPSPRFRRTTVVAVALVSLFAGAVGGYLVQVNPTGGDRDRQSASPAGVPASNPGAAQADAATGQPVTGLSVSAPLGDHRHLAFDLVSDATRTTVRTADLTDRLYVITASDVSAVPKVVTRNAGVELSLVRTGQPGSMSVEIQLNSRVRWQLRLTGAAAEHVVDVRDGGFAGIAFGGGASRIVLSLPRPDRPLSVQMTGGASEFVVNAPSGVLVRFRIGGGADNATIDTTARSNLTPGTVFTPDGYDAADKRYGIDATAHVSSVRLNRY